MPSCAVCRDRRHVPDAAGEAWVPCPACHASVEAASRLETLPAHLRDRGLADLGGKGGPSAESLGALSKVLARLAAGDFPRKYVLLSGKKPKDALAAAAIRDATLAGVSCDRLSLSQALDFYFSDKKAWVALLGGAPRLLLLALDSELFTSASAPVFHELVVGRMWKSAYTVLLADLTLAQMRGDKRFPPDLLAFLGSADFKEVRV